MLNRMRFRLSRRAVVDCREVGRVLQSYLDGELDGDRLGLLAAHLEECRSCGLDADTYGQIKESLSRRGDRRLDPVAIARLQQFGYSLSRSHPASPEG